MRAALLYFCDLLGFIGKRILVLRLCNHILHANSNLLHKPQKTFLPRYLVKQFLLKHDVCLSKFQEGSLPIISMSIAFSLIVEWSNNSDIFQLFLSHTFIPWTIFADTKVKQWENDLISKKSSRNSSNTSNSSSSALSTWFWSCCMQ